MTKEHKDSFYVTGKARNIEMPPLGYQLPEEGSQPKPIIEQQVPSQVNQAFSVPDQLDPEIYQEMDNDNEVQDEVEQAEVLHEEQQEDVEEVEQPEPVAKVARAPVKKQEENFKAIREAKERAERERDLLLSKLVEMQAQQQPKQKIQEEIIEQPEEDFDFTMNDDDLLEGKHAKRLVAELKKMKSEMKSYKTATYNNSVESKIKNNFPDFESVVSQENVAILNEEFPELAASLRDTSDIYNKAAAAYSVIKRMGIYKEQDSFMKEKQIAIANSKKPRPLASVSPQQGDSPLSKANAFANGLTPELKEQMRREMNQARKGH
jgi:hypothetical protein